MANVDTIESWRRFDIPGRVTFLEGNGDLPKVEIKSEWSNAEVYLHGATVTDFRLHRQPSVLFVSQFSRFAPGAAIRGGVPVIFPWFGPREGEPMHGFARLADWELHEATALPPGGASLRFGLPEQPERAVWTPFTANYVVTVTDRLVVELIITNCSRDQPFSFENCLHSYFHVGDINAVAIRGLQGAEFLDKTDNYTRKRETAEAIKITAETDRVFLDTKTTIEIVDEELRRVIHIEKEGSLSTIVWNPWATRSQQMPDFGNDEYRQMVCVESGNVGQNKVTLAPGHSSVLKVMLSTSPL